MTQYVREEFERVRDSMVDVSPEQLATLQAEAKALRRVFRVLTEKPLDVRIPQLVAADLHS